MNYSNSRKEEWTSSENKKFQNAIAELDVNSPSLYENIKAKLPWKTIEQIERHYKKLVEDVLMIERGEICSSKCAKKVVVGEGDHRRKGTPWTDKEHRSFLVGLDKLGKGEWRNISRYYVPTKLPSQVASHGQKYFRRLKSSTPLAKRRFSIHDIRIHNSSIVKTSARNPSRYSFISHIPHHDLIVPNANSQHNNVIVGHQHSNSYSSSVRVISTKNNVADNNTSAPATLLTSSSSNSNSNNNNNHSEMIMGSSYEFNVNNMCYVIKFANYGEVYSQGPYYSQESHGIMPFYFPKK